MRVIGIIAEYNPFHLGHLYQINKIKEMYPDALLIAIVSTCFTERGDISLINKWNKTEIALSNGIDLVVELPTLFATQSADIFAYASVNILANLGIDTLVFGSETNKVDMFTTLAKIQLYDKTYDNKVRNYIDKGINYPTATSKALYDISHFDISKPNDLLALSYVKEIIKNGYKIEPISIKRTNDYHGNSIQSKIISGELIRKLYLDGKDISSYLPNNAVNYMYKDLSLDKAYRYLLYNIINNKNDLDKYLTVDEGINNRILDYINNVNCWDELVKNIKSKRYTYNKINRMLIHILLDIKKSDIDTNTYIRILGFNDKGRKYLNSIKKNLNIPLYTAYRKNISRTFDIEFNSTYIYALITNDLELIKREYQKKPIILK